MSVFISYDNEMFELHTSQTYKPTLLLCIKRDMDHLVAPALTVLGF